MTTAAIDLDQEAQASHVEEFHAVLFLEYEGSRYQGSQLQKDDTPTIQRAVEEALHRLTGQEYRVAAASRTDAGVDALGQVVSFSPRTEMDLQTYQRGLNHYLPRDIAVTAAYWAPSDFHVRKSATSRIYRYTVINRASRPAIERNRAAHVRETLDTDRMAEAARVLHGWMDVRPFTGPLPSGKSPLRRYDRVDVVRDGDVVTVTFEANGFLNHQVRRTVGALVRVGADQMTVEEFHRIAESGRPGEATWTMPAEGLCLVNVRYDGFPPKKEEQENGTNQDV